MAASRARVLDGGALQVGDPVARRRGRRGMRGQVILSHGLESGPHATKVSALAEVATAMGWREVRPDYRDLDASRDVTRIDQRIARALAAVRPDAGPVVFAGSSMGAFTSGLASLQQSVRRPVPDGAAAAASPATRASSTRRRVPTTIVHAWDDELIPCARGGGLRAGASCTHHPGRRRPSPRPARRRGRGLVPRIPDRARVSVPARWFAPCAKGFEYLLVDELKALGAERGARGAGGRALRAATPRSATAPACGRAWPAACCCRWRNSPAPTRPPNSTRACTPSTGRSTSPRGARSRSMRVGRSTGLINSVYTAQKAKDAIVDRLRAAHRRATRRRRAQCRPARATSSLRQGRAIVSIDLAGAPLHRTRLAPWQRRRTAEGEPRLRDAAARRTGRRSTPRAAPLLDPMCGTGTLLIEGALMAADVAPGLRRASAGGFHALAGFDAGRVAGAARRSATRAREAGLAALQPVFFGATPTAALHRRAQGQRQTGPGVAGADPLRLRNGDRGAAGAAGPARRPGGLQSAVRRAPGAPTPALYRELGDALRRGVPRLARGLSSPRRANSPAPPACAPASSYALFNGALECTPATVSTRCGRRSAATRRQAAVGEGAQMVAQPPAQEPASNLKSLARSAKASAAIASTTPTCPSIPPRSTCTEDGGDRIPARAGIRGAGDDPRGRRRAPLRRDRARRRARCSRVPRERIAIKTRGRGKGGSKYGRMDQRGEFIVGARGRGCACGSTCSTTSTPACSSTTARCVRVAARMARGKRFLNLFCYTGDGQRACRRRRRRRHHQRRPVGDLPRLGRQRNLALNGIAGEAHRLVQADAMAWLAADRGPVRPDLRRPADVLQLQARRRFRRAARPRAPAARCAAIAWRRAA